MKSDSTVPPVLASAYTEITELDERSRSHLDAYYNRVKNGTDQLAQVFVYKNNRVTVHDLKAALKDMAQAVAHMRDILEYCPEVGNAQIRQSDSDLDQR